ncbi:MAG: hypothetical protein HUU16_04860 [Candidatus Omnitrophica bacterium]|nr:hypothetical protein [Candidatus Omnitrophota bacterium]
MKTTATTVSVRRSEATSIVFGGNDSNGGTILRGEHAPLLQPAEQRGDSLFEPLLDDQDQV